MFLHADSEDSDQTGQIIVKSREEKKSAHLSFSFRKWSQLQQSTAAKTSGATERTV